MICLTEKYQDSIDQLLDQFGLREMAKTVSFADFQTDDSIPLTPANTVVVAEDASPEKVIERAQRAHHIVAFQSPWFTEELCTSVRMVGNSSAFLASPLQTLLLRNSTETDNTIENSARHHIQSSREKAHVMDLLSTYMKSHKGFTAIEMNATSIIDELIMNAAFDAPMAQSPVVASTRERYAAPVEVFWGHNQQTFALGCADTFGSIEIPSALSKIERFLKLGAGQALNMGTGGAGIGLGLAFNLSMSLVIGVERGRRTVVCCTLPLNKSRRSQAEIKKSLHILLSNALQ